MSQLYDHHTQMEPLLIGHERPGYRTLMGLASELLEASGRLDAAIVPATARGLGDLVVGMNCYYSNLIEGRHTFPVEIERALLAPASEQRQQDLPTLAVAHIAADRWAQSRSILETGIRPFIMEVHRIFFEALPPEMRALAESGDDVAPGQLRYRNVRVGQHVAPAVESLDSFLTRYANVYEPALDRAAADHASRLEAVVASLAAHHRLVWIHPFLDGNGRVARIVLDAMLRACGVNPLGLWSLSRGFAKTAKTYKERLALADSPRQGNLDGRGNLSEKGLVDFIGYGLQTATDQARFMSQSFEMERLDERLRGYFTQVRFDLAPESAALYWRAIRDGEFARMEAHRITGLPERTARNVLGRLVEEGFLVSDTPKGKVRAGFPVRALGSLFPNLYPAGDVDQLSASPDELSERIRRTRIRG
ncbi:MAG: Fic family protein [Ferrovum sp.]|nr:Fic family protein [Ferrovum sp.]